MHAGHVSNLLDCKYRTNYKILIVSLVNQCRKDVTLIAVLFNDSFGTINEFNNFIINSLLLEKRKIVIESYTFSAFSSILIIYLVFFSTIIVRRSVHKRACRGDYFRFNLHP